MSHPSGKITLRYLITEELLRGIFRYKTEEVEPVSSVGIVAGYGLDGPGIESRWVEIICRPDRPWGPPSLRYNGYRVFPWGRKRPGRDADPSPPSSAEIWKWSSDIPLLSLRAFVAYKKGETYLQRKWRRREAVWGLRFARYHYGDQIKINSWAGHVVSMGYIGKYIHSTCRKRGRHLISSKTWA